MSRLSATAACGMQVLGSLPADKLDDRSAVERELERAGVKVEAGSSLLS